MTVIAWKAYGVRCPSFQGNIETFTHHHDLLYRLCSETCGPRGRLGSCYLFFCRGLHSLRSVTEHLPSWWRPRQTSPCAFNKRFSICSRSCISGTSIDNSPGLAKHSTNHHCYTELPRTTKFDAQDANQFNILLTDLSAICQHDSYWKLVILDTNK